MFGFFQVPEKYSDSGVREAWSNPFLLRAAAKIALPKGEYEWLLRVRGKGRLWLDGKVIADRYSRVNMIPEKGDLLVSDFAGLHSSTRLPNAQTRVSIDTTFVLKKTDDHRTAESIHQWREGERAEPLTLDSLEIYNIFGRINPEKQKRILLIAHWDTRRFADKDPNVENHKMPVLGANDGASGVAVLLTLIETNILNTIIEL